VIAMIAKFSTARRSNAAKKIALMFGIATLVGLTGTAAHAQNYPWCSQYTGAMGGSMNCGFSTYEQCQANVGGIGGFCIRNDTYQPTRGARGHR
jgi:Protein of unknown function (DUF3551)